MGRPYGHPDPPALSISVSVATHFWAISCCSTNLSIVCQHSLNFLYLSSLLETHFYLTPHTFSPVFPLGSQSCYNPTSSPSGSSSNNFIKSSTLQRSKPITSSKEGGCTQNVIRVQCRSGNSSCCSWLEDAGCGAAHCRHINNFMGKIL